MLTIYQKQNQKRLRGIKKYFLPTIQLNIQKRTKEKMMKKLLLLLTFTSLCAFSIENPKLYRGAIAYSALKNGQNIWCRCKYLC